MLDSVDNENLKQNVRSLIQKLETTKKISKLNLFDYFKKDFENRNVSLKKTEKLMNTQTESLLNTAKTVEQELLKKLENIKNNKTESSPVVSKAAVAVKDKDKKSIEEKKTISKVSSSANKESKMENINKEKSVNGKILL